MTANSKRSSKRSPLFAKFVNSHWRNVVASWKRLRNVDVDDAVQKESTGSEVQQVPQVLQVVVQAQVLLVRLVQPVQLVLEVSPASRVQLAQPQTRVQPVLLAPQAR